MSGHDQEWNFIDPAQLFIAAGPHTVTPSGGPPIGRAETESDEGGDIPKITRLPEGIEVIEQRVGRAIGNWILQVRCQCGRRWFETQAVDATHCPRCGMYVYIDVQAGSQGPIP